MLRRPPPPRQVASRGVLFQAGKRWRRWRFRWPPAPRHRRCRRTRLHARLPLLRLPGLLKWGVTLCVSCLFMYSSLAGRKQVGCQSRSHPQHHSYTSNCHPISRGHPGPKSRGIPRSLHLARVIFCLVSFHLLCVACAGSGATDARVGGNPRQEPPEATQHGFRCLPTRANPDGALQFSARHPKPVRKRAFLRAQHRAMNNGQAKYRGRWWTASELGCQTSNAQPLARKQPAATKSAPRLRFLSWNAGGLPSERNMELQAWLSSPEGLQTHIVAVQETHWRGPLEYSTGRFFAIHSGSHKAEAGLLLLLDKQVFAEPTIQYREVMPGRLIHARIETNPCIDLVVGYQYAWSLPKASAAVTSAKDAVLAKRAEFWAQLTTLLSALPARNRVLFLGDLNTTFSTEGTMVGRGVLARQGSHAPDTPLAQDLLRSLDLVVLNSWGVAGARACTYLPAGASGRSQIDFAIMRRREADAPARCAAPQLLPFVPHTGMRHLPLLGTIPMPQRPETRACRNPINRRRVQELCRTHAELPDSFQRAAAELHGQSPHLSAHELLTHAWRTATASLPRQLPVQVPQADHRPVLKLWRLRQTLRDLLPSARTSERALFRAWQCRAALQAHQRALRRMCRARKKQRFDQMLSVAADTMPGLQRVYQVLRVFAPKAPRRKLQLRAANGMPLCIADTVTAIRDYYATLFSQSAPRQVLPAPFSPMQITTEEFCTALQRLSGNKALPPAEAPATLWKLAAETLTAKLLPQVNHWLRHMHLPPPDEWNVADICLLPKPNKPVAGPETLRPISLLHPVAKALAVVINHRIQPQLHALVQELPQFSYLAGRSVQDALDRAMSHCCQVRSILHAQRQNPHLKRQGHQPSACRGGITLSLDLQQAFDLMPRDSLLAAMQLAQIDHPTQYAILQLHHHAQMRIAHGGCHATVETTNGVRQGCGLAPSLWCLFTCLILTHIQQEITREVTTVYADDFLFQWIIESPEHFEQVVAKIGYIMRTLKQFGMRVSPTKTVLLISLRGPMAGRVLRTHITTLPGKGRHLQVPLHTDAVFQTQSSILLPIVPHHTYLGARLSYSSPEALTLKERMKLSWTAFGRLLPALRSAGLALPQRVQLWKTCVFTCLLHSLDSVGLAPGGASAFRQHVLRQLRILSKSHSYITRETGDQLLARLEVEDPVCTLARRVECRLQSCRLEPKASLQTLLVHKWWQQLESCFALVVHDPRLRRHDAPLKAPTRLVAVTLDKDPKPCPVCGCYFPDTRSVRIHMSQKHRQTHPKQPAVKRRQSQMRRDYMVHSVDGMPQCCHCGWAFTAWPSFCQHFERKRCPVLHKHQTVGDVPQPCNDQNEVSQPPTAPTKAPAYSDFPAVASQQDSLPQSACVARSALEPEVAFCAGADPDQQSQTLAQKASFPDPFHSPSVVQASQLSGSVPEIVPDADGPADDLLTSLCHVPAEALAHARAQDWQALAACVKQSSLQHCLICNQWMAHAGYLSRHIKAQHPEYYVHHAWVQRWLTSKPTSVLSPCQFCGTDYKAKHCSRPRHTQACQVLYRTGLLLALARPHDRDASTGVQPRAGGLREPGPPVAGITGEASGGHDAGGPVPKSSGTEFEPGGDSRQHSGSFDGRVIASPTAGSGGRGHGHLPEGQASSSGGRRTPVGDTNGHGQGRQVSSAGVQGKHQGLWRWLGPRSSSQPGTTPPAALEVPRERPPDGQGRHRQEDPQPLCRPDQSGVKARGPAVDQSLPVELCDVLPVQGHAHRGARVHQGHSGLEGGQGAKTRDHHLADASLPAEAVAGTPQEPLRGLPSQRHLEGPSSGDACIGRQRHGPLPGVGPAGQGDEDQARSGAHAAGSSAGDADQDAGLGPPTPGGDAVPRHSQAQLADEQRGGADDAGDRRQDTGCQSSVGGLRPPLAQRGHALRGHLATAGQDGEICPGYSSAEDCRRHVRTLRLQNRGNHCYSHASILSLCWLWTSGPPALADVFGPSLLRVVRWLCTQRGPITLWQNIAWCALHVGWRSPHRQHDAVEYLTYLRPSLGIPLASGRWQSRQTIDNSCLALDEGQTWPLLLPAPLRALAPQGDESLSLQFLIDEWMHSQAGLHGLVTEPLALLLQVNRFVHSPAGISKVEVPVSPEPDIYVPRFTNSLDAADPLALQYIRYCRVACILHFGASPSEGHYRAILYDTTLGALITDDGTSAARISLEASAAYHCNGYAFIYRLCPVSE